MPERQHAATSTVTTTRSTDKTDPSWVKQAADTARVAVLVAYASAIVLLAALAVERWNFQRATGRATDAISNAQRLAATILLEDERLTMSANLAAATGDTVWIQRYNSHIPLIDAAIREATALAPTSAVAEFDGSTRVANDSLVQMERTAFALIARGDLAGARRLLQNSKYAEYKTILGTGSDRLLIALENEARAEAREIADRSRYLIALLAVFALIAVLLWSRLSVHLGRSERAFEHEQLKVTQLAMHDALTGLPNRRHLRQQLEQTIARAQREGQRFAVMVLDLDRFKPINDRFGHAMGDALLAAVSQRLQVRMRQHELAARVGGDEFVVILSIADGLDEPLRAAQRLISAICEPITLPVGEVRVGVSIGVALYPSDGVDADDLVRRADVALYRAKETGGSDVRFFQRSMDDEVKERATLELDLRTAISERQIVPYFHPLIDLQTGALLGFEVLARWEHPVRGIIGPEHFVQIAEDSAQIDAMTMCVMRSALTVASDWGGALTISLNISPQQIQNPLLVESLLSVLSETGFPASRLEVEITESALMNDLDMARRAITELKRHSIRVALDDFGTGYSSLSHLSELPFDRIKIDRSFVRTLGERESSATIVNAIIGLGKSLKLSTTAEGIESEVDAEQLASLGCSVGQGFWYSRPIPGHEVPALIARQAQALERSLV